MLVMAIIGGAALYMSSDVGSEYKKKKTVYDKAQKEMQQVMALQGKVQTNASYVESWDHTMKTETRGTFLEHWKEVEKRFSGKELTGQPVARE